MRSTWSGETEAEADAHSDPELRYEAAQVNRVRSRTSRWRRRGWLVILIVGGIFLLVNGILFWQLPEVRLGQLRAVAVGPDGRVAQASPTPLPVELVDLSDSRFFRLTFPDSYQRREEGVDTSAFLEHYRYFDTSGTGVRRFTVTVKESSAASIDEVPAVRLRRDQADEYDERTVDIDGRPGLEFSKRDGNFERVAFFWQPGLEITFAMTSALGATQRQGADQEYEEILASLRWR